MLLLVCLVYYPGHLATAVCFKSEVKGNYLTLSGRVLWCVTLRI